MNFFNYRGIDFEEDISDEVLSKEDIIGLFNLLPETNAPIFEVIIEGEVDEFTMEIHIENDDSTEFRQDSFDWAMMMRAREWDASLTDEDYECDVIFIDMDDSHLALARSTFHQVKVAIRDFEKGSIRCHRDWVEFINENGEISRKDISKLSNREALLLVKEIQNKIGWEEV